MIQMPYQKSRDYEYNSFIQEEKRRLSDIASQITALRKQTLIILDNLKITDDNIRREILSRKERH